MIDILTTLAIGSLFGSLIGSLVGYYLGKEKFRFESAHKRRIEVIEELYRKLVITRRSFADVMNPLQLVPNDKETKKKHLVEVANAFSNYFFEHRIFFEKTLADDIEAVNRELQEIWVYWEYLVEFPETPPKEKVKNWQQTWKRVDKDMQDVIRELETKFRVVLGIK
jgi:hypothetical protein